jgi:hypothetical protein
MNRDTCMMSHFALSMGRLLTNSVDDGILENLKTPIVAVNLRQNAVGQGVGVPKVHACHQPLDGFNTRRRAWLLRLDQGQGDRRDSIPAFELVGVEHSWI